MIMRGELAKGSDENLSREDTSTIYNYIRGGVDIFC